MKIALVQSHILWEDKEANKQKAKKWIQDAVKEGAELILFPEMSFTGFSMNVKELGEDLQTSQTLDWVTEAAKTYDIGIGAGYVEQRSEKGKNRYVIVDKTGKVRLNYAKMHPFSYAKEDTYYEAGNGYEVVNFNGVPLTVFICYDLRFPMNFWKASEQAHLMILPANWPKRRIEQFKILLQARAIENQVYMAAINCVGTIAGIEYSGATCFINPKGEVVQMVEDKEALLVIDWEDDVEEQRKKFPVHQDRRPEER